GDDFARAEATYGAAVARWPAARQKRELRRAVFPCGGSCVGLQTICARLPTTQFAEPHRPPSQPLYRASLPEEHLTNNADIWPICIFDHANTRGGLRILRKEAQ